MFNEMEALRCAIGLVMVVFIAATIILQQWNKTNRQVSEFKPKLIDYLEHKRPLSVHHDRIYRDFPGVERVVINIALDDLERAGQVKNESDGMIVYDSSGSYKVENGRYAHLVVFDDDK